MEKIKWNVLWYYYSFKSLCIKEYVFFFLEKFYLKIVKFVILKVIIFS